MSIQCDAFVYLSILKINLINDELDIDDNGNFNTFIRDNLIKLHLMIHMRLLKPNLMLYLNG